MIQVMFPFSAFWGLMTRLLQSQSALGFTRKLISFVAPRSVAVGHFVGWRPIRTAMCTVRVRLVPTGVWKCFTSTDAALVCGLTVSSVVVDSKGNVCVTSGTICHVNKKKCTPTGPCSEFGGGWPFASGHATAIVVGPDDYVYTSGAGTDFDSMSAVWCLREFRGFQWSCQDGD